MSDFTCMGDPHLGRQFRTGVPLHRIGNREKMVWAQFEAELLAVNTPYHINSGDLFDKFVVPPEVVIMAAHIYLEAAKAAPKTMFIVLQGNHDVSRDTTKSSSFDLFKMLVAGQSNIVVITEPTVIQNMGFVPFDPFVSAAEAVAQLPDGLERVFTHFDYQDWGGDQVLPTELLASKGIFNVTNGHDHLARVEKRHGVTVTMTGSMQPYSHAEDPNGLLYRTVTLAELGAIDTKDLNLRVLLAAGETLPDDIDCLSLIAKRMVTDTVEPTTEEFDSFDINTALRELLPDSIRDEVMEVFHQ